MISCNGRGACIRAYIFCICYYFFVIGIEFILADPHFLKKRYVSEFSPSKKKKWHFNENILICYPAFFRFRKRKPWIKYKIHVSGLRVNFQSCVLSCNVIQRLLAAFWGAVTQLYPVLYVLSALHFSISSAHKTSAAGAVLQRALRHPPVWARSILWGNQDMGEKKKAWCLFTLVWNWDAVLSVFLRNCNEDLAPVPLILAHISVAWDNLSSPF